LEDSWSEECALVWLTGFIAEVFELGLDLDADPVRFPLIEVEGDQGVWA
jgi:hypothetical protein